MHDATLTPRQRRRRKRLREIRGEAMQMVVDNGIEGFSVNQLAARIDLTPGALYRYFDSKDDILAAVKIEVLEGFDAYFQTLDERTDDGASLQRLVTFLWGYLSLEKLQPERFRLISRLASGPELVVDDDMDGEILGPALHVVRRFVRAIEDAQVDETLAPGDALQRAAIIWSGLQGLINHKGIIERPRVPLVAHELIEELILTLLIGWGADAISLMGAVDERPDKGWYSGVLKASR